MHDCTVGNRDVVQSLELWLDDDDQFLVIYLIMFRYCTFDNYNTVIDTL
jgi:hypothetical protein